MINKLFKLLTFSVFIVFITFGYIYGEEPICEIGGELTQDYKKQVDSCNDGNKVNSYFVMNLIDDEDGIEKLQALLEYDCIEGFRNSIGKTITDDWAQNSKLESLYMKPCSDPPGFLNSWVCYFWAELLDRAETEEQDTDQILDTEGKKLSKKLKILVNSDWFTEEMRDRIGLTEFDVALLQDDKEKVVAIMNARSDMKENTPTKNAELLRFLTSSKSMIQYLVTMHENYSSHLTSSHIKDPSLDTVVMLSGSGGTAWSYSEFNHAIEIIERLGLNWVLVGDGVRGISLEDVAELKPLFDGLDGELMFWICAHGRVDEETGGHIILLDYQKEGTKTRELFESLKIVCENKAIDVILNSCYSGAAYKDATEVFSEGSRFLSTAPVDASSTATGKLLLNGVDHFMKSRNAFNSAFELFSLGYLYKMINIKEGPQILISLSNIDPFILELDKESIDFNYAFENKERIINYLDNYLDEETQELIKTYIDSKGNTFKSGSAIDEGNLSRILQFAVGMIRDIEDVLNEGKKTSIIVNENEECEKLLMHEEYVRCKLDNQIQRIENEIKAISG